MMPLKFALGAQEFCPLKCGSNVFPPSGPAFDFAAAPTRPPHPDASGAAPHDTVHGAPLALLLSRRPELFPEPAGPAGAQWRFWGPTAEEHCLPTPGTSRPRTRQPSSPGGLPGPLQHQWLPSRVRPPLRHPGVGQDGKVRCLEKDSVMVD